MNIYAKNRNFKFEQRREEAWEEAQSLVGTQKGNLKIISATQCRPAGQYTYDQMALMPWLKCECQCEAKTIIYQPLWNIVNDKIKSCGCANKDNGRHRSKSMRLISYKQWRFSVNVWSEITGIPARTIYYRINAGKGPYEIFDNPNNTTPLEELINAYEKKAATN